MAIFGDGGLPVLMKHATGIFSTKRVVYYIFGIPYHYFERV